MLKLLKSFHGNVIAVSAEGTVTGNDYEEVLIPAIEKVLETHNKVRLLYHFGNQFKDLELGAIADDAMFGIKHITDWEKIAIVTNNTMINALIKFFGFFFPARVKLFKDKELDDAKNWIIE